LRDVLVAPAPRLSCSLWRHEGSRLRVVRHVSDSASSAAPRNVPPRNSAPPYGHRQRRRVSARVVRAQRSTRVQPHVVDTGRMARTVPVKVEGEPDATLSGVRQVVVAPEIRVRHRATADAIIRRHRLTNVRRGCCAGGRQSYKPGAGRMATERPKSAFWFIY